MLFSHQSRDLFRVTSATWRGLRTAARRESRGACGAAGLQFPGTENNIGDLTSLLNSRFGCASGTQTRVNDSNVCGGGGGGVLSKRAKQVQRKRLSCAFFNKTHRRTSSFCANASRNPGKKARFFTHFTRSRCQDAPARFSLASSYPNLGWKHISTSSLGNPSQSRFTLEVERKCPKTTKSPPQKKNKKKNAVRNDPPATRRHCQQSHFIHSQICPKKTYKCLN